MRFFKSTAIALVIFVSTPAIASAEFITDLGEGWTATGPDGYTLQSDGPPDFIGASSTSAKPTKLIVGNWDTFDPIKISFTHTGPDAGFMFFSLRMELTNKTDKAWGGFKFSITDDNGTPKATPGNIPPGDNLFHPFHAHYHIDHLDGASFEFDTLTANSPAYSVAFDDLEDRGIYDWMVSDGHQVAVDAVWSPQLIVMHKKLGFQSTPTDEKFTISLQAIAVPEPSTAILFTIGFVVCSGLSARKRTRAS